MLNPLYEAVAYLLVHIYYGLRPLFGANSGTTWALSIVLLTVAMRIILIPLFVKQIRLQRKMQIMQPKIKELQAKFKNDKERLNKELMELYRTEGANPLTGCLPLLLQFPIFIGLFHILNTIKPNLVNGQFQYATNFPGHVLTVGLIKSAARAKIFGVPIGSGFTSSAKLLTFLGGNEVSTRILVAVLIVAMVVTTFITQRQLMARSSPTGQMAQQQKIMLYVLPLFFTVFGFRFQLGVLLYWVTTNVWSMGQQAIVIRRMEPATGTAGAKPAAGGAVNLAPRPGQRPNPGGGAGGGAPVGGSDGAATLSTNGSSPAPAAGGPEGESAAPGGGNAPGGGSAGGNAPGGGSAGGKAPGGGSGGGTPPTAPVGARRPPGNRNRRNRRGRRR